MPGEPKATVVVATYRRAHLLPALVAGLAAQDVDLELVVVDDASPDGTPGVLGDLAAQAPFPLRVFRQATNQGPAAARNRGWRAARGPVVAFTDDDCVPQPGWLRSLLDGIDAGADIVQGRTVPDPEHVAELGPFGRTMRVPHEEGFYETCNIAYRRGWLERTNGFDESYRRPYGEDTDLAWRAREAGARTTFAESAVVHHAVFRSDWWAAVREVGRCDGLHRTLRKHPQLRGYLGKRLFHRPAHAASLLALAAGVAVLAAHRSPLRWVAAAGAGARYAWVARQSRPAPPRKADWLTVVPAAFVLDVYETAMYARASVKERALLL